MVLLHICPTKNTVFQVQTDCKSGRNSALLCRQLLGEAVADNRVHRNQSKQGFGGRDLKTIFPRTRGISVLAFLEDGFAGVLLLGTVSAPELVSL